MSTLNQSWIQRALAGGTKSRCCPLFSLGCLFFKSTGIRKNMPFAFWHFLAHAKKSAPVITIAKGRGPPNLIYPAGPVGCPIVCCEKKWLGGRKRCLPQKQNAAVRNRSSNPVCASLGFITIRSVQGILHKKYKVRGIFFRATVVAIPATREFYSVNCALHPGRGPTSDRWLLLLAFPVAS